MGNPINVYRAPILKGLLFWRGRSGGEICFSKHSSAAEKVFPVTENIFSNFYTSFSLHFVIVLPYEIFVVTGDKLGAGTSSDVKINLFGQNGDSGERPLIRSKSNKNPFERKQVNYPIY